VFTAVGGGAAIGARALASNGNTGSALVATGAAVGYLIAAIRARGFLREQLGPDDDTRSHGETVRHVLAGLVAGARHVRSHPSVVRAFVVIGVQRFAYGVSAICTLLLYRNYFVDAGAFRAGLAGLGQLVAALAIGGGLAAAATPMAARRIGYTRWPAALLMGAGVVEVTLGLPFTLQTFLPAGALLGFAAQGIKICVDTLVAQRVADDFRGRVFSLYDTLFNLLFVGAAVLTATVLPENGRSAPAIICIALAYSVTGVIYWRTHDTDPALSPAGDGEGPATQSA
jgi:hypothetical protein